MSKKEVKSTGTVIAGSQEVWYMWISLSLARGSEYEGGIEEHTAKAGRGWITWMTL